MIPINSNPFYNSGMSFHKIDTAIQDGTFVMTGSNKLIFTYINMQTSTVPLKKLKATVFPEAHKKFSNAIFIQEYKHALIRLKEHD